MKKTRTQVDELFSRVAEEVSELGDDAMARLYPALVAAERELEIALKGMMDGVLADETFTRAIIRRQLAQLKKVRTAYRRLAPAMVRTLDQIHGHAKGLSLANLKREMEAQLATGEFSSAIESQVNLFAADAMTTERSSLVPRFERSVARYPGQVWQDINTQLQVSVLKGETVFEATNRLLGNKAFTQAVGKNGIGTALVKGNPGIGRRYRYWAERLVRTETMGAYNDVHQQNITGLSKELATIGVGILKRWDATNDLRVCKVCRGLHGVAIPVDAFFPVYRGSVSAPPAHPNCRCVLTTLVPGLDAPPT